MSQRGSGKPPASLAKSLAALLDVDKVELSKTQVAAFIKLHADHCGHPRDSDLPLRECDAKLLALTESVLQVFNHGKEGVTETAAQKVMDDLREAELHHTKTGKRLAGLLAILQEVNQSIARIQHKIQTAQKAKLPSEFYMESGYTQLKTKLLIAAAQKRLSLESVQKEINSIADYSKNGLFSELKAKVEDIKQFVEQVKRIKERTAGFWLERQKENYVNPTQDFFSKPTVLDEDQAEFQDLLKAYEKVDRE